jgi:2',3'-cyclic-nucleotide 2'-phosphodiesterase (5'-nucleotidase family)
VPYLILDSGDNFPHYPDQLVSKYVVLSMRRTNYTAVCPGELEFIVGQDYIVNLARNKQLPFVCANVKLKEKGKKMNLFPECVVKNIGKHKVLITGIVSEKVLTPYIKDHLPDITFEDPITSLKEVLSKHKNIGFKILISHAELEETYNIINTIEGIDIVFNGHIRYGLEAPQVGGANNKTAIVSVAPRSENIGLMLIYLTPEGKLKEYSWQLVAVSKDIEEDKKVLEILSQYEKENAERQKQLLWSPSLQQNIKK